MKRWLTTGFGFMVGMGILLVGSAGGRAQSTGPLENGKALYEGHCASCHGMTGGGDGLEAAGLTPPPTNFRSAAMANVPDNDFEQAILAGTPDTAMRGYGTIFTSQEVADLIVYLRSLSASP